MNLQPRVSVRYKVCLVLAFSGFYAVFYTLPNLFPLFPPTALPLWAIDRWVPFVPWTFVLYLSDYVLAAYVILCLSTREQFNSFARMAFTVLVSSGIVFIFFPTSYPRPDYPSGQFFMVQWLMDLVQYADAPTNCFPSMHVAITSTCAYSLRHQRRPLYLIYWFWSLLIFASTMTTKQHYFVDILGGLVVAGLTVLAEIKLYQGREFRSLGKRFLGPWVERLNR